MKVDLRYIVFFSCDYDYGYIQDIKSGGNPFVTHKHFCYHHFTEHGKIAYFAYIVEIMS